MPSCSILEKLIVISLVSLIFSSCAPVYYPNDRNVPLFTKGGEFQGSASLQPDFLAERVAGFDAQWAFSVSNHLAIMGNFSYCRYNNSNERSRRHKFFEGGVGYFQNKGRFAY